MLSLRLLCLLILLPMDGSVKHWNAFELLMVQVHRRQHAQPGCNKKANLQYLHVPSQEMKLEGIAAALLPQGAFYGTGVDPVLF